MARKIFEVQEKLKEKRRQRQQLQQGTYDRGAGNVPAAAAAAEVPIRPQPTPSECLSYYKCIRFAIDPAAAVLGPWHRFVFYCVTLC